MAAHDTQKPDIWQARDVTLSEGDKLTEVRVGIFDSGVDTSLYPGQLYDHRNSEPYPSQGLAFTDEGYPSSEVLLPVSPDQRKLYEAVQDDLEALSDLQAGIESPAGAAFKKRLPQLSKNDVEKMFKSTFRFFRELCAWNPRRRDRHPGKPGSADRCLSLQ